MRLFSAGRRWLQLLFSDPFVTGRHPTELRHKAETNSTSTDARTAFHDEDPVSPIWFTTDRQTQGKGRRDRIWHHIAGNFAGTLLLPIQREDTRTAPLFAFIAGLAVADTLDELGLAADKTRLKWPNDVLVEGRKICGILCELLTRGQNTAILVGIGVNLVSAPSGEGLHAISVQNCLKSGAHLPDHRDYGALLDHAMMEWWHKYRKEGFAPVRSAWLNRAAGLGGSIRVQQGDHWLNGEFCGIREDGALQLKQGQKILALTAGDIFLGSEGV